MASIKIDPGIHRPLHVTASNRKHVLIVYFPVFSLSPALDATYNQLASPSPSLKENGNYSTNHYYYVLRHTYFQRKKTVINEPVNVIVVYITPIYTESKW